MNRWSNQTRHWVGVVSVCLSIAAISCKSDGGGGSGQPLKPEAGNGGTGSAQAGHGGTGASGSGAAGHGGTGSAGTMSVAGTGSPAGMSGGGMGGGDPVFDAGSDELNHVMPGQICERLATIQCAGEAFCCDNPRRSQQDCHDMQLDICTNMAHFDQIAGNTITGFDKDVAFDAFTEFERLAKSCDPTVAGWGESVDGLRGILKGTRATGAKCTPTSTDPGSAGAALASCSDLADNACLFGKVIGGVSLNWSCAPRNDVGGNCFSDINCKQGVYCDNPQMEVGTGHCKMRNEPGAACVNPNECSSLFCKGQVCSSPGEQPAYCLLNDLPI